MSLRSRQVLQLSPQVYPNVRPASASPSAFLISIARIPFLLLISSYCSSPTSQSTARSSVSVSTTRIALSHDLLSLIPLSSRSPLSPPRSSVCRLSSLSIRNSVLCVNIVRRSKDTWRALLQRSRF